LVVRSEEADALDPGSGEWDAVDALPPEEADPG
jgi:hypothetical protein